MRAEKWMEAVMKELGSMEEKVNEENLNIVMCCAHDNGEKLSMEMKVMGDVANVADMLNSALITHLKRCGADLEDAIEGMRGCWGLINETESKA